MAQMLFVYGSKAYASELDLFREAHVCASRAHAFSVVGRAPAMIFRVRHSGGEMFVPDLGDVYRITRAYPHADVQLIMVHGQSRVRQ